jgi:hypothetical protein
MAGQWMLFYGESCHVSAGGYQQWDQLYNLRRGTWQPLQCSVCESASDEAAFGSSFVLGWRWLWLSLSYECSYSGGCPPPEFISIPSGKETEWQPTGQTAANVDAATLKQHVCWPNFGIVGPLSAPEAPGWSQLVWWSEMLTVGFVGHPGSDTATLEGCNGEPSIPLFSFPGGLGHWVIRANQSTLIWATSQGRDFNGILIPSLQRFHIHLPVQPDTQYPPRSVWLTSSYIYVLDSNGRVWRAPLPTHP